MRGGTPWAFGEGFLQTLLSTGVFSGIFLGLVFAFPPLFGEKRASKAFRRFLTAGATGLAVPMMGAVLFALSTELLKISASSGKILPRFLWWTVFASSIGISRALLIGNSRAALNSLVGLLPGMWFGGLFSDLVLVPRGGSATGFLFLGFCAGLGLSLSLEVLKEAWLEESSGETFRIQFILETEEFLVGSSEDCDFSVFEGPAHFFLISERDGVHILEALDDLPVICASGRFRYRALLDGDCIDIWGQPFVYHSRYSRTRDVVPEGAT